MSAPDADRIRAAAGCDALRVRVVDESPSTNEALMQLPFGDAPAPVTLIATLHQTAGRGRRGRAWLCEPGRSCAFSIAFERLVGTEPPPAALSIVVGAAAAIALAPWAPGIALKWPNDLQIAGRKLGGILVETRRSLPLPGGPEARTTATATRANEATRTARNTARANEATRADETTPTIGPMRTTATRAIERIVVGIGINLVAPREVGLARHACGLFDGSDIRDDPGALIGCVAGEVVRAFEVFRAGGLGPFVAQWERRDALRDEPVVVLDGDRVVAAGRALGIDADGALRLLGDRGLELVRSGEVSVRRSGETAARAAAQGPARQ